MSDTLAKCPFCGNTPVVKARAYYWPSSCYVSARIFCPTCKPETNNERTREDHSVSHHVFWTDEEILKHVPDGLSLGDGFNPTTARAAKAAARSLVVKMWQRCKT